MQRVRSKFTGPGMLFGLAAGIAPFAGRVRGAVVYGNFVGTDVTYTNVTETPTQLPGPTPAELFGPPVISGDTLMFMPSAFSVGASGGSNEFQDSHLSTGIVSTDTKYTKTLDITEGGGWAVGGGTAATTALESLVVNDLFITAVNGVSINPIVVTPVITFTDTNNGAASVIKTADSIEFTSTAGFSTGSWNADANFNLSAALAADGVNGVVTGMSLGLDNQLAVTSETNSDAFIDKKFFDIGITGTPVPEPTSAAIAMVATAAVATRRRPRIAGSVARMVGTAASLDTTGGINAKRVRRRGKASV